MKEEIQNSGMELNDQALENVGGGRVSESQRESARRHAEDICKHCDLRKHNACAIGAEGLANSLLENGIVSVRSYTLCPFYHDQLHKGD